MLVVEGYLTETPVRNGFGTTIDNSEKGRDWLRQACRRQDLQLLLRPNQELTSLDREVVRPELTIASK